MVAITASALFVRGQLKATEKDRYLTVTNQLFTIWQSEEFMRSQFWLLHKLDVTTWKEFIEQHRADTGEMAFHRVGSFYDRIGTLVRLGLANENEILSTIGPHAIAVWQKIEPLVKQARAVENSVLFDDFELLLPSCHECYVPALGQNARVNPFSLDQPGAEVQHRQGAEPRGAAGGTPTTPPDKISPRELKRRLDRGDPISVLDVRQEVQLGPAPLLLPRAVWIPPAEVQDRASALEPGREVVVYCT